MAELTARAWSALACSVAVLIAAPGRASAANPEPAGWYAGDPHVHRSCGGSPEAISSVQQKMTTNDLAAISLLADMGNGEVQDPVQDLPRVNGQNDPISTSSRIVHWDSEWHWDAIYNQYPHQALGGHVVALGVSEAHQIWQEYTKPIFDWAHGAGGVAGFAHMQYLDDAIPQTLSCCTPIEYPVEVALGSSDFISEDVVPDGASVGGMNPDAAMNAYYRLLNTGFRPGWAAGTDYPCNSSRPLGGLLTYGQVAGGQMDYRAWVNAIAKGRTVVSRNGHNEFLSLVVNGTATPGDQVDLATGGSVPITVTWTANQSISGTLELVSNGVVVASKAASVTATSPVTLGASVPFPRSGWIVARRMGSSGHVVHTAAVFVIVGGAPIRASASDAAFYVQWMETLLTNTSPGGAWSSFFPTSLAAAQARYLAAKAAFQQIETEALAANPPPVANGVTIWPATAVPTVVDEGPDSPAEIGVKFRSDVAGSITGIRFYKATTNVGTHVGNLWSSAGALLASATFTNETTSGWQEVDFATPVPIAANTVYVASYHVNGGHYPEDDGYFASAGVDAPPLHALRDGESGPNSVYAYSSTSVFPTQAWMSANYWVDVVFRSAAQLASLSVTPASSSPQAGTTVRLAASATYSDGTTADVTSQAAWTTSSAAVATVSASGLVTAVAPGAATISATLSGVTASSSITVTPAPLAVTTASLAGATQGAPYSAVLAATGGTPPYAWSLAAGTLPAGITLAPTGALYGTPTALGTFSFTVQATGAAGEVATGALTLTASAKPTDLTIWGTAAPTRADLGTTSSTEVGVKFRSDVAGVVKGIRFYKSAANTGTHVGALWTSGGTRLATVTFTNETASGWQQALFATPVAITANTVYVASYHANVGHYAGDDNYFTTAKDAPPLHALASSTSTNGVYRTGTGTIFPNRARTSTNFWVDVVFAPPATLSAVSVAPPSPSVLQGGTVQLAATGTYSDGTTRDLTASATWSSTIPSVATASPAGLITALTPGSTTVSATSGGVSGATLVTVVAPALAVSTSALAGGVAGVAYAATLSASGGTAPYGWSIVGALPPGLALNPGTGVISGTPTAAGSWTFTAQVTDAASAIASHALSIAVVTPPALSVATTALPGATKGVAYSTTLAAAGGVAPFTWSLSGPQESSGLPPGISLASATGVVAGTPSAAGTFSFVVAVTDAAAQVATATLSIAVAPPPALSIATVTLPDGTAGIAYSATLAASGGVPPYAWSIPAGLPPGLSVTPAGVISGTPSSYGAYGFDVSVTDAAAQVTKKTLSILVGQASLYSLWPSTATPTLADSGPDSAVELGVRFRADVAGSIVGIRFYKGAGNTGTHVGSLWSSSGTKLATATFTGETATGWQQVLFSTPVAITAGTAYVASYHTNVGHYADDQNFFAVALDRPPLHAPANAASAYNGMYAYGSSSTFPSGAWNSSNYWVDVVFSPSAQLPTVKSIAVTPATSSLAYGATQQLQATATYSDSSTLDVTGSATWTSSSAAVAVSASGLVTGVAPGSVTVTATLSGVAGSAAVTVSPPPPEGPGGPLLVVSSTANPFSRYYAEILRAEGLNEFTAMDASSVDATALAGHDVVILGEFPLTDSQASMFASWVNAGGNLVAMRPDAKLAGLLGLVATGGTLANGYVLVNTSGPPGQGIVGETMQYHGPADLYALGGATQLAALYQSAVTTASAPAVTLRAVGAGQAAAFTYDLARSVVYTRQGNPAWSGKERDGVSPIRSDDLFYGPAASDPQPDWVDFSKIQLPQADEQQRLLANLLLTMNQTRTPLPRFWYLPSGLKAAILMTGDDHAGGGTAGRFAQYVADGPAGCVVDDWQCVRSTSYLYPGSPLTDSQAKQYTALGFEVALHLSTGCADFAGYADLDAMLASQLVDFAAGYPSASAPVTNRTHCIAFSDYDTAPKVERAHGIRLDANYYYWPGSWLNDRPGLMTGSGFPMRFADRNGQTTDVYQAMTQFTDESGQTYPLHVDTLLDNAVGAKGYYGVFTANMHTDAATSVGSDAIVSSARARGVPIVSARQMLTWLDGRNGSSFGNLSWSGGVLSFTVSVAPGARNLRAMLPVQAGGLTLSAITRAGTPVTFATQTIKGVAYAFFPVASDAYQATYR
jgi:uncharacterized protein YjdB